MEYLIVTAPGKEGQNIDVLIKREKNGKVGKTSPTFTGIDPALESACPY